jgi:hypothetical protein
MISDISFKPLANDSTAYIIPQNITYMPLKDFLGRQL